MQDAADEFVRTLALEARAAIRRWNGPTSFTSMTGLDRDAAKQADFLAQFFIERLFAAAGDDVRGDADFAELGDGLLGGFGLQFAGRLDEGT